MVPVPARRWVEAGRAARLARSVGTDLGESREHPEHPQFWKVESREDQVQGWVVLTLFLGQFLTLKIVIVTFIFKPLKGRSAVHSCQSCV